MLYFFCVQIIKSVLDWTPLKCMHTATEGLLHQVGKTFRANPLEAEIASEQRCRSRCMRREWFLLYCSNPGCSYGISKGKFFPLPLSIQDQVHTFFFIFFFICASIHCPLWSMYAPHLFIHLIELTNTFNNVISIGEPAVQNRS